ncbi:hypothetical protein MMC21_003286 [Puttea exsequens]|nr:hypothetical protein [Puttea exsequens]
MEIPISHFKKTFRKAFKNEIRAPSKSITVDAAVQTVPNMKNDLVRVRPRTLNTSSTARLSAQRVLKGLLLDIAGKNARNTNSRIVDYQYGGEQAMHTSALVEGQPCHSSHRNIKTRQKRNPFQECLDYIEYLNGFWNHAPQLIRCLDDGISALRDRLTEEEEHRLAWKKAYRAECRTVGDRNKTIEELCEREKVLTKDYNDLVESRQTWVDACSVKCQAVNDLEGHIENLHEHEIALRERLDDALKYPSQLLIAHEQEMLQHEDEKLAMQLAMQQDLRESIRESTSFGKACFRRMTQMASQLQDVGTAVDDEDYLGLCQDAWILFRMPEREYSVEELENVYGGRGEESDEPAQDIVDEFVKENKANAFRYCDVASDKVSTGSSSPRNSPTSSGSNGSSSTEPEDYECEEDSAAIVSGCQRKEEEAPANVEGSSKKEKARPNNPQEAGTSEIQSGLPLKQKGVITLAKHGLQFNSQSNVVEYHELLAKPNQSPELRTNVEPQYTPAKKKKTGRSSRQKSCNNRLRMGRVASTIGGRTDGISVTDFAYTATKGLDGILSSSAARPRPTTSLLAIPEEDPFDEATGHLTELITDNTQHTFGCTPQAVASDEAIKMKAPVVNEAGSRRSNHEDQAEDAPSNSGTATPKIEENSGLISTAAAVQEDLKTHEPVVEASFAPPQSASFEVRGFEHFSLFSTGSPSPSLAQAASQPSQVREFSFPSIPVEGVSQKPADQDCAPKAGTESFPSEKEATKSSATPPRTSTCTFQGFSEAPIFGSHTPRPQSSPYNAATAPPKKEATKLPTTSPRVSNFTFQASIAAPTFNAPISTPPPPLSTTTTPTPPPTSSSPSSAFSLQPSSSPLTAQPQPPPAFTSSPHFPHETSTSAHAFALKNRIHTKSSLKRAKAEYEAYLKTAAAAAAEEENSKKAKTVQDTAVEAERKAEVEGDAKMEVVSERAVGEEVVDVGEKVVGVGEEDVKVVAAPAPSGHKMNRQQRRAAERKEVRAAALREVGGGERAVSINKPRGKGRRGAGVGVVRKEEIRRVVMEG